MPDIRTDTAFAVLMAGSVDAEGFPPERAWEIAPPICFNADWQGKNADGQRGTQGPLRVRTFVERFEMPAVWRVNFFRVEGAAEPRFYSAWRLTNTSVPNFHVPEAFGVLVFTDAASKIRG